MDQGELPAGSERFVDRACSPLGEYWPAASHFKIASSFAKQEHSCFLFRIIGFLQTLKWNETWQSDS